MKKSFKAGIIAGALLASGILSAASYSLNYPVITGYWGTQAITGDTFSPPLTVTPLTAAQNGYNTIILTFAGVSGDGATNLPVNGMINFFMTNGTTPGYSYTTANGAITFPSPSVFSGATTSEVSNFLQTIKTTLPQLNSQGVTVLLSIGGANAALPPSNLPTPQAMLQAFQSMNYYLSGSSTVNYIQGIDWDLENGVDGQTQVEWMAQVSILFKQNGYIVTCAPQSTNFNPTYPGYQAANWNCYVPLIYAMESAGTPIDAINVQWYEPGGSKPTANTVASIQSFVAQYYSTKNWTVTGMPSSTLYQGTSFNVGLWLSQNPNKLVAGIGAGQGWTGVTNYTPSVLVQAYQTAATTPSAVTPTLPPQWGGYMVWDTEIDSGQIATWANGTWTMGNGLKVITSSSSSIK